EIIEGQQMAREGGAEVGEAGEAVEAVAAAAAGGRPDEGRGERPQRPQGRPRDRRSKRRTTYVPPGAPPIPEPAPGVTTVDTAGPVETQSADQPGPLQEAVSIPAAGSRNGEVTAEPIPGSTSGDDAFKKAEVGE